MRNSLLVVGIVIGAGILLSTVSGLLMLPEPHEFYIQNPANNDARKDLQNQLREELRRFKQLKNEPIAISSGLNDPDRNCPVDVTTIAYGIQNYMIDNGELPQSMDDLFTNGYVNTSSLEWTYSLNVDGNEWEIYGAANNLMAEGN